ncbi:MAG: tyrosine-protein phosphatase [Dehalococcoidia bacterium]
MVNEHWRRIIQLSDEVNFRDFGGYPAENGVTIKWGMLYRSARLSKLSDADVAVVRRLGLNRIIDLRTDIEIQLEGHDRIYAGNEAKYDFLNFGYGDPQLEGEGVPRWLELDIKKVEFSQLYVNMLEQNRDRVRRVLERFTDPGQYPVLVHCTQGKDRTGIIAALLLMLLGVSRETIVEDYMLTAKLVDLEGRIDKMGGYLRALGRMIPGGMEVEDWAPFFSCLPDAIDNLFEHIENEYNGINALLSSIGIPLEQQNEIRRNLLCDEGFKGD